MPGQAQWPSKKNRVAAGDALCVAGPPLISRGRAMPMRCLTLLILPAAFVCGCQEPSPKTGNATSQLDPLPVQQAKAYPETVTGLFVSLVDFENTAGEDRGYRQVASFVVRPASSEAALKFVVNNTRTGVGAMSVTLPAQSRLVFPIRQFRNFSGYTLLLMAVYIESVRDDLCVTLTTDGSSWQSPRTLLRPGWNTVLIDLQHLRDVQGFDITSIRTISLSFAEATSPVEFCIDDVMLINNYREIKGTPKGIKLVTNGLDYQFSLPYDKTPVVLAQCGDGLWRLKNRQPVVQILAPDETFRGDAEDFKLLGDRRVGHVEIAEMNPIRLRIVNTWFFPTRAGEWISLAVRQIRWEETFYFDGRWITHVELNNSGGEEIGSVRLCFPEKVVQADGVVSDSLVIDKLSGPVCRWNYILPPPGQRGVLLENNYVKPAEIKKALVAEGEFAEGDADKDGFDESQGCFFLRAKAGHCRFTVVPPAEGLLNPVFRIHGEWDGPVSVTSEGLVIRDKVQLEDGSVLFVLDGELTRPTAVEVTGKIPQSP